MKAKHTAVLLLVLSCMGAATAQAKKESAPRKVPPVWSAAYNAEQGPLPETSGWNVVHKGEGVIVRLAPQCDWSHYRDVQAGDVRYTGSEMKLTPRQIAEVTDLLQTRLGKDLRKVKLEHPQASGALIVDANITEALANPLSNLPAATASMVRAHADRANIAVWLRDGQSHEVVAEIEMYAGDESLGWVLGPSKTGHLRAALRAQSKRLAEILNGMNRSIASSNQGKK